MATETGSISIEKFEATLYQQLCSEPLPIVPSQVTCSLEDAQLIIQIHYREPAILYPKPIVHLLQQAIAQQHLSLDYQLTISLVIEPAEPFALPSPPLDSDSEHFQEAALIPTAEDILAPTLEPNDSILNLDPDPSDPILTAWRVEDEPASPATTAPPKATNKKRSSWTLLGFGVGIGLLGLILGYGLSRPCVIGQCATIPEAQAAANDINNRLRQSNDTEDILSAQQQLRQTTQQLQAIPPWSSHREPAQQLLSQYQDQLDLLQQVINALTLETEATRLAESFPLSVEEWESVQERWKKAIAILSPILSQQDLGRFAQTKSRIYEQNLAIAQENLNQEIQALDTLKVAQETAKIAQARQKAAQSLANWQQINATWKTAIKQLRDIPPETTPYQQAQTLLEEYLPEFTAAAARQEQEQLALDLYNRATQQADLAQKAQKNSQWSTAVGHWRNALSYTQQVPSNSFQATPAQSLISTYTKALDQAQTQLRIAVKIQQAYPDLDKTCTGTHQICRYSSTNQLIQVRLTPTYMQQVWQTALHAKAQDNLQTQVDLLAHISTLEQALKAISNKAGVPIKVYNPDGEVLVTYKPNTIPSKP